MTLVLSHLVKQIRSAAVYNANTQHPPAVILWTDKEEQWQRAIHQLYDVLPELFILGEYDPDNRVGPAIWLKCVIAGALETVPVPQNLIPVIYLPGVSRAELRDIGHCSEKIKPLVELQYRGALWGQINGKDWTVNAYLASNAGGLGLDVAKDKNTKEALLLALPEVLSSDVDALKNKLLEASDFNQLLTCDPIRDLLSWMNSPASILEQWSSSRWKAVCCEIKLQFNLDLENDGDYEAAESLCKCEGPWVKVWQRFQDSPDLYPRLPTLLERVPIPDFIADRAKYPRANKDDEGVLFKALQAAPEASASATRNTIIKLENNHKSRRDTVWAKIGQSPWVLLLEPLTEVAERTQNTFDGLTAQEVGDRYKQEGWLTDAAVLKAIALCEDKQQLDVVESILTAIYTPWLADLTERFQRHVKTSGYPETSDIPEAVTAYQEGGEIVFFVDGLRLDVAYQLQELLVNKGIDPGLTTQWSALPSVTATAKAAVSPIYSLLTGLSTDKDFEPSLKDGGTLSYDRFKRTLINEGWQYVGDDETGDPSGNAWVACGDIDKEGHKSEMKLPRRIPSILNGIVDRILELQQAGWQKIRVVTDHGWLLVPGKMPKSNLPIQATESRWGRCAQLKQNIDVEGLTLGWYWNAAVPIHFPHGIHSFIAGKSYGHGGVSLQECLVPVLTIEGSITAMVQASIKSLRWVGLKCKVEVTSDTNELKVDLRTKLADSTSSLVTVKPLKQNKATLMVLDDSDEGISAMAVILDQQGNVLAKLATIVGGDE